MFPMDFYPAHIVPCLGSSRLGIKIRETVVGAW